MADLATDIDFEVFCVVFGKSGNAALAGKDVFPESPTIISQTTDNPDSRNENPLHSFGPTPANNDDRLWLKTCIPARPTRPWVLPLQYEPGKQGIQGVLKQTSAGLQPSGGVFAVIGAELVRGSCRICGDCPPLHGLNFIIFDCRSRACMRENTAAVPFFRGIPGVFSASFRSTQSW